jgi:hypothetical protein
MQHHRVLARDEWFPARRRLSRGKELTRRRDQVCGQRCRNEAGADFELTGWMRRHDQCEELPRTSVSAA